jgi:hypothetical protein
LTRNQFHVRKHNLDELQEARAETALGFFNVAFLQNELNQTQREKRFVKTN